MTESNEAEVIEYPSFVDFDADPVSFFAVEPVGDAATDRARGIRLAEEAMRYAQQHHNSMVIGLALAHISLRELSPLEFGFLDRIASAAAVGSVN